MYRKKICKRTEVSRKALDAQESTNYNWNWKLILRSMAVNF